MKKIWTAIKGTFFAIWLFFGFVGVVIIYGSYVLIKAKILEKRKGEEASREYVRKVVSWFGRAAFHYLWSEVTVFGKENIPDKGPYVIVANHQSIFDIPLILGYIYPSGFIAKKELLKVPLLGTFIKKLGSILIDRDSPTSGAIALKNFARITQTGDVITIFPEGTRSIDGKVNEFKKGSLLVPYRYNIKVLPVTIDGTIGMNKKGSILIKPGKVKLYIHNVIEPKTFSSEAELRAHVQNVISRQIAQNSLTKAS